MNKVIAILVILLIGSTALADDAVTGFLNNYFETSDYNYQDVVFVTSKMVHAWANHNNSTVIRKSIFFRLGSDNSILPVLLITNNTITDRYGVIIFKAEIKSQLHFGWTIDIIFQNNSMRTIYYTNNGTSVTDGPVLMWDHQGGTFKVYVVDRSQW